MPVVARFNRTPVKGMALEHPEEVALTPQGIPGDRLFFFVDASGALFSVSDFGPLVRVHPVYDASAERLKMIFPDGTIAEGDATDVGIPCTTDFYGRSVAAYVLNGPWGEAASDHVGVRLRLLRCDRAGDGTDVHHLTLVSLNSVRDLAERGGHRGTLDPSRFRINVELEDCVPYQEDTWEGNRLRLGGAQIQVLGQIPRCVVTTQDPGSGEKDWNTLTHIARYRPRIAGDGGLPFGMYAEVLTAGRARVGNPVLL